jgi:hypothetical protein
VVQEAYGASAKSFLIFRILMGHILNSNVKKSYIGYVFEKIPID